MGLGWGEREWASGVEIVFALRVVRRALRTLGNHRAEESVMGVLRVVGDLKRVWRLGVVLWLIDVRRVMMRQGLREPCEDSGEEDGGNEGLNL